MSIFRGISNRFSRKKSILAYMKKYTHAWLAMMAMKRIEKAKIPARQSDDAKALITWFKNYRDFVLSGAWYPDSVFKDMTPSHIVKYEPDTSAPEGATASFRVMPPTLQLYQYGLRSDMYGKPFLLNKRHTSATAASPSPRA